MRNVTDTSQKECDGFLSLDLTTLLCFLFHTNTMDKGEACSALVVSGSQKNADNKLPMSLQFGIASRADIGFHVNLC